MSQEDIQLYRLFLIFGAAILGFAGLRRLSDIEGAFLNFLSVGSWIALALLIVTTAVLIYVRCVKKVDESGRVVTSVGVAYFLIPTFFILFAYPYFDKANAKFQLLFALISVFAVIYNIFKREFKNITALTFVCAIGLYYTANATYDVLETIFAIAAKALMIAAPAIVIVLLICAFSNKKGIVSFGKHKIYELPSKFGGIVALVVSAALLLAALLLLFVPTLFTYVMISILVLYVALGIVCTIRLI